MMTIIQIVSAMITKANKAECLLRVCQIRKRGNNNFKSLWHKFPEFKN